MERLTEVTVPYLQAQIAAGAQIVQLFDSWVGCLSSDQYRENVLPYSAKIFASLKGLGVPTIHFGTNTAHLLPLFSSAGGDVVSVDWRVDIFDAWQQLRPEQGIQGNLDPAVMMASDEAVKREASKILESVANRDGHIFNLGHGVHAETPPERLAMLADFVHSSTVRTA
jgi:uroporphyrinogen decarboxylase